MSVPSQELPVDAEPEEPVAHEEHSSLYCSNVQVEAEAEPLSTDSTSLAKEVQLSPAGLGLYSGIFAMYYYLQRSPDKSRTA
jgi:hypothetical protein